MGKRFEIEQPLSTKLAWEVTEPARARLNERRQLVRQPLDVGRDVGLGLVYSVGVYSTEPAEWVPDNSVALCDEVKRLPEVPVTIKADGPATIETYSVRYDWPIRTGIIIGRLDDNGRFLATSEDENLVALLSDGEPLGASIVVRATEAGNRATLA